MKASGQDFPSLEAASRALPARSSPQPWRPHWHRLGRDPARCAWHRRLAQRGLRGEPDTTLTLRLATSLLYGATKQERELALAAEEPENLPWVAAALASRTLAYGPLADPRVTGPLLAVLRLGLASSLNGQGRHEEALAEVRRADELRRDLSDGPGHPGNGASGLIEATALLGLGRKSDARARAVAAHDEALAAFGTQHFRVAEARALLARIDDGDDHGGGA
ncbi:hypothetical protein [Streptomyces sp. cg2]|uniref:hypothetical protein n=1 Tax=Streptomyces sp. cg2 TaxID=3238799 RepID=UPI0034E2B78A